MTNLETELRHFTGSEHFFRNPLLRSFVYTEGVHFLAERAGAYWLIDYVMSNQYDRKIKAQPFQVWTIKVREDRSATIRAEDGNGNLIRRFRLEYADFPLKEFSLWFIDGTLMLPSEY